MKKSDTVEEIPGYCALCWSSCGCISVVKNGRLTKVLPDRTHPTGQALCGKGQAAPELVYSKSRITHPLKRTQPKNSNDPGWVRISWDEALDTTADNLKRIAEKNGSESVAFSITTSAGTAMQDGYPWVERLRQVFGTPNAIASIENCDFSKDFVYPHTFGVAMPMSDLENTDCIILWGHNPGTSWLAHGTRVAKARARGAKLIVMDPIRVGFAAKADQWLQIRPGTDGALALCLAGILIKKKLFDIGFVRDWTNGPLLVRDDNREFLTGADLLQNGDIDSRVAWNSLGKRPVLYHPETGTYDDVELDLSLEGSYNIKTFNRTIRCRPAFQLFTELCSNYTATKTEEITWIPAEQIIATAKIIGDAGSVCCYSWAGLEQHSNTSQTGRAVACLYAITGNFDKKGGNVIFETIPMGNVSGAGLMSDIQHKKSVGLEKHPLGPESVFGWITTESFYDAVLEEKPYKINALMSWGGNVLLSHADGKRGEKALASLEFMAHADLFMTPSAAHADIFLPVNTPWEREALKSNFLVDQKAVGFVQFRKKVVESEGESRSDAWIAFELAKRLGFGKLFWNGDVDKSYEEILEPSGIKLKDLRRTPSGIQIPLHTEYQKYSSSNRDVKPGFSTPSKKVELYSETFYKNGYDPLPAFHEPSISHISRPDLAKNYPLILTTAKSNHFLGSQSRSLKSLRRHEKEPEILMHPETAHVRGIIQNDWATITTPHGEAEGRVRVADNIDPRVIKVIHGWWQNCEELGLKGYIDGRKMRSNMNSLFKNGFSDPIGGCEPLKSYLCQVKRIDSL